MPVNLDGKTSDGARNLGLIGGFGTFGAGLLAVGIYYIIKSSYADRPLTGQQAEAIIRAERVNAAQIRAGNRVAPGNGNGGAADVAGAAGRVFAYVTFRPG